MFGLTLFRNSLAENQFQIASKLQVNNPPIIVNSLELQSKFWDGINLILSKCDEYFQANL
jgi:hypothetical protein